MSRTEPKELRLVIRALQDQGFTVELTRSNHYKVRNPEGRLICTLAGSSGGGRGFANALAVLRRAGFKWGR